MNRDGEFVSRDCTLLLLICGLGRLTSDMVKSYPNYFATMDMGGLKQGRRKSQSRDSEYIT